MSILVYMANYFHKTKKPPLPGQPKLMFDFYKPTTDSWYPNYDGDLVRVHGCVYHGGNARVSVSGNDDFYMELEFHGSVGTSTEWYRDWSRRLSAMSIITIADMRDLGFVNG